MTNTCQHRTGQRHNMGLTLSTYFPMVLGRIFQFNSCLLLIFLLSLILPLSGIAQSCCFRRFIVCVESIILFAFLFFQIPMLLFVVHFFFFFFIFYLFFLFYLIVCVNTHRISSDLAFIPLSIFSTEKCTFIFTLVTEIHLFIRIRPNYVLSVPCYLFIHTVQIKRE
jgi:hypothetical protein